MEKIQKTTSIPILRTKLYKPLVKDHYVIRQNLIDFLEKNRYNPLTLVVAATGYGKSVTVSEWLDHTKARYFIPLLIRTKVNGINRFGSLIQYHNNLYRQKWMEGNMPDDDKLLPSLDNSSMADINGSYLQAVKGMTVIPINRKALLLSMLMLLIPFLPLIFTKYSLAELFSGLVKVIGG